MMNTKKLLVLLITAGLLSGAVFAELIASYDFEGAANLWTRSGIPVCWIADVSGNGIDGFAANYDTDGQATLQMDGLGGSQCLSVNAARPLMTDNNDGYFRVYLPEGLHFYNEMTVAFWVKRYPTVYNKSENPGIHTVSGMLGILNPYASVALENNAVEPNEPLNAVQIFNYNVTKTVKTQMTIPADDRWHFFAVRFSETLGLYIQVDDEVYEDAANFFSFDYLERLTFGLRDILDASFSGEFDDIKIYRGSLTAEEIDALYQQGRRAEAPAPYNTEIGVDVSLTELSWVAPDGNSLTCDVFFDDDDDLSDATQLLTDSTATSVAVPTLLPDTTYYWRVDYHDIDTPQTLTGNVWSFQSQLTKATAPVPADGTTDVSILLEETDWQGAYGADSYVVYFGTDQDAVATRSVPGIPATGSSAQLPLPAPGPANFDLDTTYYWAVDTISGTSTIPGDVWSATTDDYVEVELMQYADANELKTVWSGDVLDPDFIPGGDPNQGDMQMDYHYARCVYSRLLGIDSRGLDLSSAWEIHFSYSFSHDNTQVQSFPAMQVQLLDASDQTVYTAIVDELLTAESYVDVSLAGATDLSNVRKVQVVMPAFTDTTGYATFDNLGFSTADCNATLAGDVNKDCVVDMMDLSLVAADWLGCTLIPIEACD